MSKLLEKFHLGSETNWKVGSGFGKRIIPDPEGPQHCISLFLKYFWGGFFNFFSYYIQHCLICRPSDSTVPTDAGIEPRTVATGALAVRSSLVCRDRPSGDAYVELETRDDQELAIMQNRKNMGNRYRNTVYSLDPESVGSRTFWPAKSGFGITFPDPWPEQVFLTK